MLRNLARLLSHQAFVRGGRFDPKWFAPIVTMCSGKGLPNVEQLDHLLALRELMVDGETNLQLLKCVASMNHSMGMPAIDKVQALFGMEELLAEGRLNTSALNGICTLFHGKGIPSLDQVKSLWHLKELQTDNKLDPKLLAYISSMNLRKGMPDLGNVSRLLSLSVLQLHGRPDVQSLRCLARIFHSKGVPKAEDISQFISRHNLAPGGKLNLPLLQQIAKLSLHTGFPKDQIVAQARADLSAWGHVEDIDDEDDDGDALGIGALAELDTDGAADIDMDEGEDEDALLASAPQIIADQVIADDGITDDSVDTAASVVARAGSPAASDGFELPEDFDIEQAATGLSFGFWESDFDELLASTSADAELQPLQDHGQQPLAGIDFWESFTMPPESTTAEDAVPSTSAAALSAAPASPTLVGKSRSYLASHGSKGQGKRQEVIPDDSADTYNSVLICAMMRCHAAAVGT